MNCDLFLYSGSSSAFNIKVYLANNSDLKAAGFTDQQAYTHFLVYGLNEGRQGSDYAGNTLEKARNISVGGQETSFTDWVGNADTNDFYKLNLVGVNNLTIALNTFSDINMKLIRDTNNNGASDLEETIASSTSTSVSSKELKLNSLASGIYFLQVYSGADANGHYDVKFVATPTPPSGSHIQGTKWNDANGNGIIKLRS
ncbi:hypothetical protein [Scytonema sp. NUACC26]|uniref:hypothetical protein n=1 Tax=Scytonema sp. NUACC26 TaxID=3140176 RepID=UPI0034DC3AEA